MLEIRLKVTLWTEKLSGGTCAVREDALMLMDINM